MTKKVLVLGGYGNFGKRLCLALAKEGIPIIIAGRNQEKAEVLSNKIRQQLLGVDISIASFDINCDLSNELNKLKPHVVINASGPFQMMDYSVAECCIQHKIHYIDLSDGREFVNGIQILNEKAREQGVLVISGASTVPGLSSAVIEHFKPEFSQIDSLIFGISPGQKAPRGSATTQSILSYLGKPLKNLPGSEKTHYGWQDLYRQQYPELGKRWMANCDIPDLDLFPDHYGIKSIRFSAGMESGALHFGMWLLSWCVRLGLPLNLPKHADFLLRLSHCFDFLGTGDGGMHILMKGIDVNGKPKEIKWFIIAKDFDGPQIPTIPAIVLAKKLVASEINKSGAMACVGMVTLEEYLAELSDFDVTTYH